MKSAPVYVLVVCFIAAFVAADGRLHAALPDPVSVQLKWVHQTQFAGFYVAMEKGYYADENLDRDFQSAMFDAMLPLVNTGEDSIGWMHVEDWRAMHRMLVDQGIIPAPLSPVDQVFTLRFLESIGKDKTR